MKVTHSAIYKVAVSAECGCTASIEFLDAAYHEPSGKKFEPCDAHKGTEGIASILHEVVAKEAADTRTRGLGVSVTMPAPMPTPAPARPASPRVIGPGEHRPQAERPRATTPFHRVDPVASVASGPRLRVAAARPASRSDDLHGVEEDQRVTMLLERTGLLEPADDGGDIA